MNYRRSFIMLLAGAALLVATIPAFLQIKEGAATEQLPEGGYVDAAFATGYQGRTSATYTGNLGGIAGANAKCQVNYAGSHMCTQKELLRSNGTTFGGTGWVSCDLYNTTDATLCDGVFEGVIEPLSSQASCDQYTSAAAAVSGAIAGANGTLDSNACNNFTAIHCCR